MSLITFCRRRPGDHLLLVYCEVNIRLFCSLQPETATRVSLFFTPAHLLITEVMLTFSAVLNGKPVRVCCFGIFDLSFKSFLCKNVNVVLF